VFLEKGKVLAPQGGAGQGHGIPLEPEGEEELQPLPRSRWGEALEGHVGEAAEEFLGKGGMG
jgi:hypothetical protein